MDIIEILSQVKSPFTDEKIKKLIKVFIECNCDMNEFYKKINLDVEERDNPYFNDVYSRLFDRLIRGERFVQIKSNWIISGSSEEALSVPDKIDDRVLPIYRIYINAKGQDKMKIVEEYIRKCEDAGKSYKFKFSIKDGRNDEIIILSYGEELARNMELIERITEGISLGEPAELVGRYKDKIGIGEEYIQTPTYSYTRTRLGIIAIAMDKYYLDHNSQFDKYLNEQHKEEVKNRLQFFKEESELLLSEINDLQEHEKRHKEKLRNEQWSYQNNINPYIGSMNRTICTDIPEQMKAYMADHFETAIHEIIENYRLACEIFGISRKGVFSRITQEMLDKTKQTPLQQREAELSVLEAEEHTILEEKALFDKQTEKLGQNIGE